MICLLNLNDDSNIETIKSFLLSVRYLNQSRCQWNETVLRKCRVICRCVLTQDITMLLGSFQCRGVLLLWHMVGQGPAMLAAGAGWVGCFLFCFGFFIIIIIFFFFFFISPILSSFSNASSLGRRLDILKYCGLGRYNPTVVAGYYRRRAHEALVKRSVGLPRNSVNG